MTDFGARLIVPRTPRDDHARLLARSQRHDALVLMYAGVPEPPTLNAILVLKSYFRNVILFRSNLHFPMDSYPDAPSLIEIGSDTDPWSARNKSALWKLGRFAQYCLALTRHLRRNSYPIVIIHDYLALLAFSLVRKVTGYRGLSWFNSYDVIDPVASSIRRFSLMRFAKWRLEYMFSEIDFFSAPASERMCYYPIGRVRRQSFVIPNYPAIAFYRPFSRTRYIGNQNSLRLIFQGAIGRSRGLEQIIKVLGKSVAGKPVELVLKGWIDNEYKQELIDLATAHGVRQKLSFFGFSSYRTVPELASQCSIGIAIFTGKDIMNATLGTASNKIYEYAALGLPVILYDTPHFRGHLGDRRWAFFTTLSDASILDTLQEIAQQYDAAAVAAVKDFETDFNFEGVFVPALHAVLRQMGS